VSEAGAQRTVLALNCGSSSLKFALFRIDANAAGTLIEGEAEAIGTPQARLSARTACRAATSEPGPIADTPRRRGASSLGLTNWARQVPPPSATASFTADLWFAITA